MHMKNHMAMWILWILWISRARYSANQLYKPLCAFLVFVDLVWILCGSCVAGFAVFGNVRFLIVVLPSMPMQTVARPLGEGFCGSVVLPALMRALLLFVD